MDTIEELKTIELQKKDITEKYRHLRTGLLDIILKLPMHEISDIANYILKHTENETAKDDLSEVIEEIETLETIELKKNNNQGNYVAYTIDGKGLTQEEYQEHILAICTEVENGDYIEFEDILKEFENE
jgi:hypothetical protein